jgi:aryl-phospho-beta-D-glucosidase BglC (GH1 family)
MTTLNGLWAGGKSAQSDFATIAYQLQLLGFNTVRLPFLFEDLKKNATDIGGYCTGQSTLAELAERTTDPDYSGPITRPAPKPVVPLFQTREPGSCNKYIPGGRTLDRFLWTMQWFVANGWYVLIDFHPMVSAASHAHHAALCGWPHVPDLVILLSLFLLWLFTS